jgi:hypothetical protein
MRTAAMLREFQVFSVSGGGAAFDRMFMWDGVGVAVAVADELGLPIGVAGEVVLVEVAVPVEVMFVGVEIRAVVFGNAVGVCVWVITTIDRVEETDILEVMLTELTDTGVGIGVTVVVAT